MGKILNAEEGKHNVEGYSFRKLNFENIEDDIPIAKIKQEIEKEKEQIEKAPETKINDEQLTLIEKLLKKSDELAISLKNMEAKFENQQAECDKRLKDIKEASYSEGYNKGLNEAKKELENKTNEQLSRLIESIHKLEDIYKEYQNKAEGIEKELVGVAVDIAEEVIAKELSKNSKEIALNLIKNLIEEIKDATKIDIKLNPLDFDYVSKNLDLDNVNLIPDNAVKAGGVVILSNVGNIEAEIDERFNAIKKHILKS